MPQEQAEKLPNDAEKYVVMMQAVAAAEKMSLGVCSFARCRNLCDKLSHRCIDHALVYVVEDRESGAVKSIHRTLSQALLEVEKQMDLTLIYRTTLGTGYMKDRMEMIHKYT